VLAVAAETPDLTLEELRALVEASGIRTSRSALGRFLQNPGLTRKKIRHAAEQDRSEEAAARARWRQRQAALSPEHLVLIDETWPRPTWLGTLAGPPRAAARGRPTQLRVRCIFFGLPLDETVGRNPSDVISIKLRTASPHAR
jgi:hypothetical protein